MGSKVSYVYFCLLQMLDAQTKVQPLNQNITGKLTE